MSALLPILFIALVVSAVLGLALHHSFLARLRTRHVQTWEALGRPALLLNNSPTNSVAVLRFLWRREYHALGDSQSVRLAGTLRVFLAVYALLFVCTIVTFFISRS
jgi:hypothetical protein